MPERYALYFAPQRGSGLERFGAAWLGRDPEAGVPVARPDLPGLDREALEALTASPAHYAFHGTLVPPMELAAGCPPPMFFERVRAVARAWQPFAMGPLSVRRIGTFFALVPANQARLAELAAAALRALHPCRKPPSAAEKDARRAKGLTPNQERLLEAWGYPYVLEEFRFHMTLTGAVRDEACRAGLLSLLARQAAAVTDRSVTVREVCVFRQPDRTEPFTLLRRVPLGVSEEQA